MRTTAACAATDTPPATPLAEKARRMRSRSRSTIILRRDAWRSSLQRRRRCDEGHSRRGSRAEPLGGSKSNGNGKMLDPALATIVAAVIALIGTLAGLRVGYRRWSEERKAQRSEKFEAERRDIYKGLWDRVEEVNASLRRNRVDDVGFSELVADLNEFMIRNGAHLDDSDQHLVNLYVAAVKRFDEVVRAAASEDAKVPYGQTMSIPPEVVSRLQALGEAQDRVSRLRNELLAKVRSIVSGGAAA